MKTASHSWAGSTLISWVLFDLTVLTKLFEKNMKQQGSC